MRKFITKIRSIQRKLIKKGHVTLKRVSLFKKIVMIHVGC